MVKLVYSKKLQEYYDFRGILALPNEILQDIFLLCGPLTCYNLKQVNQRFHNIVLAIKSKMPLWINRFVHPFIFPLEYQFEVAKWMTERKKGGILNLEQGMGKTKTSLLYINITHSLRNLVMCNKAQMIVWKNELRKFYGDKFSILLCHKEYDGDVRDFTRDVLETYDIVVVTYQAAKHIIDPRYEISKIFWNNLFCDEVHILRNCPTSMYPYVDKIKRTNFWGLTGSLIFNSINDARNIQMLIDPNSIYKTNNIKKLRFTDINIKLPPLSVIPVSTPRTARQEDIYNRYETRAVQLLEQLGSISKNFASIFTAIHRMRQISISLALLKQSHSKLGELTKYDTYKSPRIEDIASKIEASDKQAVVFSAYRGTLELLHTNLTKRHIKSIIIKSENKTGIRDYLIERFQRKKARVLLVTYQCGSLGYTFTNAEEVYLADLWWNWCIMQQAFKRVYRLGQTKPVTVWLYKTDNSIESRMYEICSDKLTIEEVLFAEHKNKKKLGLSEIKMLFQ